MIRPLTVRQTTRGGQVRPAVRGVRGAVLAAALLVAASCASDESAIVGLWTGTCSDSTAQTFTGRPFSIEFDGDGAYVIQQARARSADYGRATLAGGEQIILTDDDGSTMTGGYTLTGAELRLTGLVDPDSRNARPHWCTLTRVHS